LWQQRLEAVSNLEGPHFSAGMAAMAKYAQYLFNLQHHTARTVTLQRMRLTAYEEHFTATSHELEKLRRENAILQSGTLPPSNQDRKLKVAYHHLSEVEHGWNYTCQQLDAACEVVDTRTHAIIDLEYAMEQ
jgi:phytoene dehydrogenase-like protein